MTAKSIATLLVIYGAAISTVAIFLALRANSLAKRAAQASGPVVSTGWFYNEEIRQLTVGVGNDGNSDMTIYDLSLAIMHETTFRSGVGGTTINIRTEPVGVIPKAGWWEGYESNQLPMRLVGHSRFEIRVDSEGIGELPANIPPRELILRFTAETNNGYVFDDIREHGFTLRHFIGLESDLPRSQA